MGISLLPIHAKRSHTIMRLTVFAGKTYNGQRVKFSIDRKHLIILDLKDVGFRRKYFARLMKKMNHLDTTASDSALMGNSNRIKYDFNEHNRMRQYKLLKLNKRTGWFGRERNNPHLTESYLLYRIANFKKIRFDFLQYIISQINIALKQFETDLSFEGRIVIEVPSVNYDEHFAALSKGIINTTQLGDIIFKGNT